MHKPILRQINILFVQFFNKINTHPYIYIMPVLDIKKAISPAKNIWQYLLAVFLLSSITTPFMWNGSWEDPKKIAMALIWSFAIWFTQIYGHTIIFQLWDKVFSWTEQPIARSTVGVISIIVYAALAFVGVQVIMRFIFFHQWPSRSFWEMIMDSGIAIQIAAVFSVFATLIGFLNAWRKSELEKERLKTEMAEHRYNALQNQVNPHFLFNSLNVLSELVYEDQDLAVKFIDQLSELYRYVLASRDEDIIPLEKEVEFIKSFSFLLKMRFQNQLEIAIEIQPKQGEFLVPMSLQLLVENAVKHNVATTSHPLKITIKRQGNFVVVENVLQPKTQPVESTKTGLSNIKGRYSHLTGQKVLIEQSDAQYKVALPIIKMEKS